MFIFGAQLSAVRTSRSEFISRAWRIWYALFDFRFLARQFLPLLRQHDGSRLSGESDRLGKPGQSFRSNSLTKPAFFCVVPLSPRLFVYYMPEVPLGPFPDRRLQQETPSFSGLS